MNTDRYGRLKPTTEGTWERVGRKHYAHISGIEVLQRPNAYDWEIVGGPEDGHRYSTLSVAQYSALRHFTKVLSGREP